MVDFDTIKFMMNSIFARGPEPTSGNVLFYHLQFGTLQAVKLSDKCYTMPVTDKTGEISDYCYHNRVPEFMYTCQWFAVPYTGGPVQHRLDSSRISQELLKLPYYIVLINFRGSYDDAYRFGGAVAGAIHTSQVSMPERIVDGCYLLKMRIPLEAALTTKFVAEFLDVYERQLHMNISVSIEPQTAANWKF